MTHLTSPSSSPPRPSSFWKSLALYCLLIPVALTMLLPFYWQFQASFSTLSDVETSRLWPSSWHPENFLHVFQQIPYAWYYLNSILIAAAITFLQTLTSSLAAYAFARLSWKGRDTLFLAYLATLMIPGTVTMIPNFALMWKLNLYNSYLGLILPMAFSAFGTFLMRQFMLPLPHSLEESARLDGASEATIFWQITLPLCQPALITLAILTFMGHFSSFFWPLIMTKSPALRTLPIGLMYFNSSYGPQLNLLMAGSLLSLLPLILLFIFFQKRIVSGLQIGAIKG